ncbi:MAG: HAMP domain-containing protein, partial [Actinomycetota bacterium]|nr:HAMP domain-containing protein [Actinomycetota bacterium]
MNRLRGLWLRRTMRCRITTVATAVTLAVLLGVAVLTSRMIGPLLVDSADQELISTRAAAVTQIAQGRPAVSPSPNIQVRVLDTAGAAVDGREPPTLDAADIRVLKAGVAVLREQDSPPARWLGTVATAPDGSQRLVVVGTGLIGYTAAHGFALRWLLVAAGIAGAASAVATWFAVRSSMRPVERMRTAAARLGPGRRLPLPDAHDELRSLAGALNA